MTQTGGRNAEVDFKGQTRSNETHRSTTDPEARLYRKGPGMEARLCFIGHTLMENRSGLIVDARLTLSDGHAERIAALSMIEPRADRSRAISVGADKAYDAEDYVNELKAPVRRRVHADRRVGSSSTAIRSRKAPARALALSQQILYRGLRVRVGVDTLHGSACRDFLPPCGHSICASLWLRFSPSL